MIERVLVVAGTRPEIIKLAPVVLEARKRGKMVVHVCATGQHEQMADEAMSIFSIRADSNLSIMKPNQAINDVAAGIFDKIPRLISEVRPDVVVVQGDTTSAAASALAAFNMRIPVAHVEAGLRSFDLSAPFPEEANRRIVGALSRFNFCPTDRARQNLLAEGARPESIFLTGNTVVDALEFIRMSNDLHRVGHIHPSIRRPFVLVTAHRRESFGQGFQRICKAIREAAERHPKLQFVYPVHLNPNVETPVRTILANVPNILLVSPVPYIQLLTLLNECEFVVTDSGGIQEEAPSFGKYCIVLREVTERMESVESGFSSLLGTDDRAIVEAIDSQSKVPTTVRREKNPYGDGRAAQRILDILESA